MACDKCFKDWFTCGIDTLYIQGVLTPDTVYQWTLTTPQGAKYRQEITTDETGHFNIVLSTLPDGLFNPYAGMFTLEVFVSDNCDPQNWNDSAYCTPYSCIDFEVKSGTEAKNYLGCDCP